MNNTTMKIKTSELTGPALDWAVAKCEGFEPFTDGISWIIDHAGSYQKLPKYSTDWTQGGPIIEREKISVWPWDDITWRADDPEETLLEPTAGPAPLIAAMRCYVASKLGNEVGVPDELL